jgi:hypothetical protein
MNAISISFNPLYEIYNSIYGYEPNPPSFEDFCASWRWPDEVEAERLEDERLEEEFWDWYLHHRSVTCKIYHRLCDFRPFARFFARHERLARWLVK